jgi:hypothetical protein
VFVGDLVDRGPDSPSVVEYVQQLVNRGRGQCVLGNHDLNLLLNHPKHENGWFDGKEFVSKGGVVSQRSADDRCRRRILDFYTHLPIALERADLRVVHACWDDDMISFARRSTSVLALYHEHADRIQHDAECRTGIDAIDIGLLHQNKNPVKIITSGPEERTAQPELSGGRMRSERRVQWWSRYRGPYCVFGHYSILCGAPRGGDDAFCVDYGVGKRWRERLDGRSAGFQTQLAALRFPERSVVFDEEQTH